MRTPRLATMTGFAGLLVTALILAACSSGASSSSSAAATATPVASATPLATATPGFTPGTKAHPRIVVITADDDLRFIPMDIPVAKGETVTFQIKNVGDLEHEFMVGPMADAFANKKGTPEVTGITRGTTKSITFTFSGPGPFGFACHATGHFEAGMKGTLTLIGG